MRELENKLAHSVVVLLVAVLDSCFPERVEQSNHPRFQAWSSVDTIHVLMAVLGRDLLAVVAPRNAGPDTAGIRACSGAVVDSPETVCSQWS